MILQILILIAGFVILIKGADVFVDGASSLARNAKLSTMVVGLTVVAFGTSAPELAVSMKSITSGNGDIVIGNVIGSNILNILLILGVASMFHSLNVKNNTVKKEIPITLLLSMLMVVLMSDKFINGTPNVISRGDGITILLFFTIFMYYLVSIIRNRKDVDEDEPIKYGIVKSIIFTILGIICIIAGSNFVVNSASEIASTLGISQRIISLTIVALGTSLPELVTSVVATKKGEYDIAIGNVVGSNIFNIGIVLGIPVAIFGEINVGSFSIIDLTFMLLSAVLLFIFAGNDYKIKKVEGIIFLLCFLVYYTLVLI